MGILLRIAVFVLLVWLAYRAIRRLFRKPEAEVPLPLPQTEILPCAHCGTHIPRPQALIDHDRAYCCREHLEADQEKDG